MIDWELFYATDRLRKIPERTSQCVLCDKFYPSTRPTTCIAFDHDLRGDLCPDCVAPTSIAEKLLRKLAGCDAPRDSILEGDHS